MKLRASILAGLLAVTPTAARAADVTTAPIRIDLTPAEAIALTRGHLPAAAAPAMQEIRLSHGAKVAIIVTAIVVGALIVVGVVVAANPGHGPHPP